MRSGIVDHQNVAHVDLRKIPVNRKFVVIFAQRTCHVIFVVTGFIFLTHDRNMVIGAIHSRTHQVYGTGVHTDVLLVDVFFMDCSSYKAAVGS